MSTVPSFESRRQSAADRTQLGWDRVTGGRARNGRPLRRAFLHHVDVAWISAAAALGFKATRAALWIAFRAGLQRKKHAAGSGLEGIECANRPPAYLAGSSRSFREGVGQLLTAGLLRKHPRAGQCTSRYDIVLPPVTTARLLALYRSRRRQ